MGSPNEGRIFGLVLSYGYAECTQAGLDVWWSTDCYFDNVWEALRDLSALFFKAYVEDGGVGEAKECCQTFEGKRLGDVLKDEVVSSVRNRSLPFCPVCGEDMQARRAFDPEHFQSWIVEQYAEQSHESVFNDYEPWTRWDGYNALFSVENPKPENFPFIERAEQVLTAALPVDLLAPSDRNDLTCHLKFCRGTFDKHVRDALAAWEGK